MYSLEASMYVPAKSKKVAPKSTVDTGAVIEASCLIPYAAPVHINGTDDAEFHGLDFAVASRSNSISP